MAEINLGASLSLEERAILSNYCNLLLHYGTISNFPMSDQEKFSQSDALRNIISKLTSEEIARFNIFQVQAENNVFINEEEPNNAF